MKYEDRIQIRTTALTDELVNSVVAYYVVKSSGLGGDGALIMVTDDCQEYQLVRDDYAALEWIKYIPAIGAYVDRGSYFDFSRQVAGWKTVFNGFGDYLLFREDIYDDYLNNRGTLDEGVVDWNWDAAVMKALLIREGTLPLEEINRRYEWRRPLFLVGELVAFTVRHGNADQHCGGLVSSVEIIRENGKIEQIKYNIYGKKYQNLKEKKLYKDICEGKISMAPGKILILSGFSGVGKGTICKRLLAEAPDEFALSVSATTREPRQGEAEGKSYFYKTRQEFEKMIANDEFLEYAEYVGNYYGTPKEAVYEKCLDGKYAILEIEPEGAMQVLQKHPNAESIFILPPSLEELRSRLKGRGTETLDVINARLKRCLEELEFVPKYSVVLVNDDLDEIVRHIKVMAEYRDMRGPFQRFTRYEEQTIERLRRELQELLKTPT